MAVQRIQCKSNKLQLDLSTGSGGDVYYDTFSLCVRVCCAIMRDRWIRERERDKAEV